MVMRVGLDRLLDRLAEAPDLLEGRRYGMLCHQASLDASHRLATLALSEAGFPPNRLFAPEHGFYGVEQDMVAATNQKDALTGCEIVSLYLDDEDSLVPSPGVFEGLDLLIVDLQDVGARYYTFAATAVWSAEVALSRGCEVWVLDRPNPLGGQTIEGPLVEPGMESFVSAFSIPVRHGLTMAELIRQELGNKSCDLSGLRVFELDEWDSRPTDSFERPFIAPSPNMPTLAAAMLYPGLCLVEGTELSEGRGTTRPFSLIGAPFVEPAKLIPELERRAACWGVEGVAFVPSFFRPQFQKHAGAVCGGVELVLTEVQTLAPLRLGVLLLQTFKDLWPDDVSWRFRAYEFVEDRPAIDLLAGTATLRKAIDAGDHHGLQEWVNSWTTTEAEFAEARKPSMLYGR